MKWIKWLDKEILIIYPKRRYYYYKPMLETLKVLKLLDESDGA